MNIPKRLFIIISSFILLLLLANWGLNVWVNNKLPEILTEKNKTPYNIQYKDMHVSIWSGNISASGISLSPKKVEKDSAKYGIYANVEAITVAGFKVWPLLFNDRIKARSITVTRPEVILYQRTEKAINNSKSIKSGVVEPFNQIATVSDVYIKKGSVRILYVKNNKPIFTATNIKAELEGIVISEETLDNKIPFAFKKYGFSCDSLYYKKDPNYHLSATDIRTELHGLSLKNFEYLPDVSRRQFVASLPAEKDLYTIKAAALEIRNMGWGFKDEQFFFKAHRVLVDKATANIYRSKVPADDLTKKHLYSKLLRDMKFPMQVDTLSVRNSRLEYEEELSFEKGAGKLIFSGFNLSAVNVNSAFGRKKMDDLKIHINCRFMESAPMVVDWKFNVLDKSDAFNIKGSIKDFDTKKLVGFTHPYINTTQKGIFDEVFFNFTGNDINSAGDFASRYHGVKVTLYKKKDPRKKAKLKTAVANLLVKDDSDHQRKTTKVSVQRIQEKSFFNFFWRNIEAGLKDILLEI
jgi:hypothetical protein